MRRYAKSVMRSTLCVMRVGRLAQLARASRLHREGRRFESYIVHQIEFEAVAASPSPAARASAGSFARNCQGFLKSISNFPAARRRFTNEIRIARRAMSRFFSFAFGEKQSEILLNCRCGVFFFNYN